MAFGNGQFGRCARLLLPLLPVTSAWAAAMRSAACCPHLRRGGASRRRCRAGAALSGSGVQKAGAVPVMRRDLKHVVAEGLARTR